MYFSHHVSRLIAATLMMSLLPACVTTHTSDPVQLTSAPVKVSCSYGPDIQTNSNSGIICNIENQSRSWQDLKIRSVRFPDQADVKVTAAEDLKVLAEALAVKQKSEDHNTGLILGGLILTGAAIAVGSTNSSAGEAVMLGGVAAAGARDVKKGHDDAQYGPAVYGSEHMLGGALRVPAEMSLRRQIVIDHPTQKPKSMEICWIAAQDECIVLSL